MCGATDCRSCGPAQGYDPAAEARYDYLMDKITDADYAAAFGDLCIDDEAMMNRLLDAVAARTGYDKRQDDVPDDSTYDIFGG
jgi:hypothetical protein